MLGTKNFACTYDGTIKRYFLFLRFHGILF